MGAPFVGGVYSVYMNLGQYLHDIVLRQHTMSLVSPMSGLSSLHAHREKAKRMTKKTCLLIIIAVGSVLALSGIFTETLMQTE